MIALRLAGCGCVLAAAFIMCRGYADEFEAATGGYSRALRYISFVRREIEYYETPLSQIAEKFCEAEGLGAAAKDGAEKLGALLADGLSEQDSARFLSFCESVGGGFPEAELRLCDEALRDIGEHAATVRDEYARRKQVRSVLTVFVAASVCLLVL